jgi:predicted nucleic acid-binding protein
MTVVLDASVYVAMLKQEEPNHAASQKWYNDALASGTPLAAPLPFLAEVAGAISRSTGDTQLAEDVLAQIQALGVIELVLVDDFLGIRAAEIAARHRLRGCDALYVALAEQLEAALVTLDQEQLERGTAVIPTHLP